MSFITACDNPVCRFDRLMIRGGRPVFGEIDAQGAKNSALPIMAAATLANSQSVLHNCPALTDCSTAAQILNCLGCEVLREGDSVTITPSDSGEYEIPEELMLKMRSSIVFLGAVIAKVGRARLSYPGGCELRPRPIDLHLDSLKQLGVSIREQNGYLDCTAEHGLAGTDISLGFPSVGATENIILAAVTAKGETTVCNAAQEPEIADLADFLNRCGAKIEFAGGNKIKITGVKKLSGCEHRIIDDRIADATYLCIAAATRGRLKLNRSTAGNLSSVLPVLKDMGCDVSADETGVYINAQNRRLCGAKTIKTMPYPGFPTDAQPPLMAAACTADSISVFVENIFDNRYKHVGELVRMGADIKAEGRVAVVTGVKRLHGSQVASHDLRGGAAVITAGLSAEGETVVSGMCHVDRGYQEIEKTLLSLGADVKRI